MPGSDGLYDNNDFIAYITAFFNGSDEPAVRKTGSTFAPSDREVALISTPPGCPPPKVM